MTIAEFVSGLLRVNLAGGGAVILVLALRFPILRLFGARVRYAAWLLVPAAMAVALLPPPVLLVGLVEPPTLPEPPAFEGLAAPMQAMAPTLAAAVRAAESASLPPRLDWPAVAFAIWIAGALVSLALLVVRQQLFLRAAKADALGPAVVGFIRPRIHLPPNFETAFSPVQQALILAHERVHLVRQDARVNGGVVLLQCLNWFNPLAHVAARLARRDQEAACDEVVIAAHPGARRDYAQALLRTQLATAPLPLGCYWPPRASRPLEDRIARLKTTPPTHVRRRAGAAMLCAFAAGAGYAAWAAQPPTLATAAPSTAAEARPRPLRPSGETAGTRAPIAAPSAPPAARLAQIAAATQAARVPVVAPAQGGAAAMPTSDQIARMRAEQEAPRNVVPFDPARFDRFVGYYQFPSRNIVTVTRDGEKFYAQLTGQNPVQNYPESETKFFTTVVAAQISFTTNAAGEATGLVLHQNGQEQPAVRVTQAVATGAETARALRISSNTPSPGTEESLRRFFLAVVNGQPNYEDMTPALAQAAREQWPRSGPTVKALGQLKSLSFIRVNTQGFDVYAAEFEHGKVEATIAPLTADGKVAGRTWRPVS